MQDILKYRDRIISIVLASPMCEEDKEAIREEMASLIENTSKLMTKYHLACDIIKSEVK